MAKVKDPRGGAATYMHYEVQDASPALAREMRQLVMGCHWQYQQQMLQILEWVCSTDRQYEHARRRALDLINGEERALVAILARAFAPKESDGGPAVR